MPTIYRRVAERRNPADLLPIAKKVRVPVLTLPERLRLQFLGLIGERVRPWLDGLPDLVDRLCREWEVELHGMPDDGWSSYVAFGTRRGEPVVLKVVPKPDEGRAEIAGLLARDGAAVPPLLRYDSEAAALLLPRIEHGAGTLDAGAAAALLRRLHIEPPEGVPLLRERWAGRGEVERLCDSWSRPVLLHGDFEARNVLHTPDGPIAIDSPAAAGDPGFDAASWALSEHDGDEAALRARIAQLAEGLDYPEGRIWSWAWPLAAASLRDKLSQPGWPPESISAAYATARLVAPPGQRDTL